MARDFKVVGCDTDSIMFCKPNGQPFDDDEQEMLLNELNSLYPKNIHFEHDGYFPCVIVLKAKNYITFDGVKTKVKGSGLRDQKKELALREFCDKIIDGIINNKSEEDFKSIYLSYLKEAANIKDIKRWASKKTITDKVFSSERTNELQIRNAVAGSEYQIADKVYLFYDGDDRLRLIENYEGPYNKERVFEKLFKTAQIFGNVLPVKTLFWNFSLKRNQKILDKVLTGELKI